MVAHHSLKGRGNELGFLEPKREQKSYKTSSPVTSVPKEKSSYFRDPNIQTESK